MSRGFIVGDIVACIGHVGLYNIESFVTVNTVVVSPRNGNTFKTLKIRIDNLIPTSPRFLNVFYLYTNMGEEIYRNNFISIKTCKEIRTFFKQMIDKFNKELRVEEKPREFIRVKREVKINGKIRLVKV